VWTGYLPKVVGAGTGGDERVYYLMLVFLSGADGSVRI